MEKVYEVESRKGTLTKVVASSKKEVEDYVDSNKSEFNLDMSGYYKIHVLGNEKVRIEFDEYDNAEIFINNELDINALMA